jgi:hypothetical protein
MLTNLSNIQHAFYINLEHRIDRKEQVEKELEIIGISATRFNAINATNGAIGCALSHLKLLEKAIYENYSHILIVEDDIEFLEPEIFKNNFNKFLELHNNWDVILISGNNIPPYISIDDTCIKVSKCQTTTGYLVNGHYLVKLRNNIKEGLNKLIMQPLKHRYFAIDKYWFNLQETDNWYLIIPPTVVQRESYSDIEKKYTNYKSMMLDLNKLWLFK